MPSQQKDSPSKRLSRPAERFLFAATVIGFGLVFVAIASSVKIGAVIWKAALHLAI